MQSCATSPVTTPDINLGIVSFVDAFGQTFSERYTDIVSYEIISPSAGVNQVMKFVCDSSGDSCCTNFQRNSINIIISGECQPIPWTNINALSLNDCNCTTTCASRVIDIRDQINTNPLNFYNGTQLVVASIDGDGNLILTGNAGLRFSATGEGWTTQGEITVPYVQARGQGAQLAAVIPGVTSTSTFYEVQLKVRTLQEFANAGNDVINQGQYGYLNGIKELVVSVFFEVNTDCNTSRAALCSIFTTTIINSTSLATIKTSLGKYLALIADCTDDFPCTLYPKCVLRTESAADLATFKTDYATYLVATGECTPSAVVFKRTDDDTRTLYTLYSNANSVTASGSDVVTAGACDEAEQS